MSRLPTEAAFFMRFLFPFLLVFYSLSSEAQSFTRLDTLRGFPSKERICYDVLSYDLVVSPDLKALSLDGTNLIRFKVLKRTKVIQVDLQPPMTLQQVLWNQRQIPVVRDLSACFIHFPEWLEPDEIHEVSIHFSGRMRKALNPPWDGGFVFQKDPNGKPWLGLACQGLGASSWWPCKDHLSDEPDEMTISVDAPYGLMAVANGTLVQKISMENKLRWVWKVHYPINTYNVTLNIGDYEFWSDTLFMDNQKPLPLRYYVLRSHLLQAKKHFQQVKPILRCFEKLMGPYPFPKDGFALVETAYLGMEHQSAIAYGNQFNIGYLGYDRSGLGLDFDFIIAHETAHEYWGNHVSTVDQADLWIHEAFATYTEAMLVECLYGKAFAEVYVQSWRADVQNKKPMLPPYHVNAQPPTDIYYKGALMLHTLRHFIQNEETWQHLWLALQKEFGMKTTTTQVFTDFISSYLKTDLTWFFDHYLKWSGPPVFEYQLEKRQNQWHLGYRWHTVYTDFRLPIQISLDGMNWQTISPDTTLAWMPVPDKFIEIDTTKGYFLVRKITRR